MHPADWWAGKDVDLWLGCAVGAIDPTAHAIRLVDGRDVEYGRLVLATGATPRQLDGAVTLRSIDDARQIARQLELKAGRLGVIGGGFIGVEVAASARMKGWDVTMAVPESVIWERMFGAEVGAYFQATLTNHGVRVLNGAATLPKDASFDLVIAGVGVSPNIAAAKEAGLPTNTGVLVNEHLLAAADIWAVGDIAEYQSVIHGRRLRIEHWDVALNQGAYVGRTWAGAQDTPYDVLPYFFSDIGDWTSLEYLGRGSGDAWIDGSVDDNDFAAYYTDDAGRLTACLTVNRSEELNEAKGRIVSHEVLTV
jgi:NADPH-dependent 2,4-dienoyl-CoA reductase/sulfur reductase-like enzyme